MCILIHCTTRDVLGSLSTVFFQKEQAGWRECVECCLEASRVLCQLPEPGWPPVPAPRPPPGEPVLCHSLEEASLSPFLQVGLLWTNKGVPNPGAWMAWHTASPAPGQPLLQGGCAQKCQWSLQGSTARGLRSFLNWEPEFVFYGNILLLFNEEARAGTFLSAKDGGSGRW